MSESFGGAGTGAGFKKYKLVDDQELIRLIAAQLREYDPTLRAMAAVKLEMDRILARHDISPEERIALLNATQQRFSQLQPQTARVEEAVAATAASNEGTQHALAPRIEAELPEQILSASSSTTTTTTPTPSSPLDLRITPLGKSLAPPSLPSPPLLETFYDLPISVPEIHQEKLAALQRLMEKSPGLIKNDDSSGEVILEGKRIPNSSFQDLMKALYEKEGPGANLTGQNDFLKTIGRLFSSGSYNIRKFIPRTSHHPAILGTQTGKGGISSAHPPTLAPPGQRISALYLYS